MRSDCFQLGGFFMKDMPITPQPHPQAGPDSLNSPLVEVTQGQEVTIVRPTSERIRKYLAGKPWLFPSSSSSANAAHKLPENGPA
jgi:hypothetical protein